MAGPQYPLDPRLAESDTYHRLWHDKSDIFLPPPQSTTNKLVKEVIGCNTEANTKVIKGRFNPIEVNFFNTQMQRKIFDKITIQTWRQGGNGDLVGDLPANNPDIDYHEDLGLMAIKAKFSLEFSVATDIEITGRSSGICWFDYSQGSYTTGNWVTQPMEFEEYNLRHLRGDFVLVTNPTEYQRTIGQDFATGAYIQDVNLPITAIINNVSIINGNSKMDVILKNALFAVTLKTFSIEIIGGE